MAKLLINGEDRLIEKDKWGNPIEYRKCKSLKHNKYFLNIWSKGRYVLGTNDIFNSKDGDLLTLETEELKGEFEFRNGRYWLIKDYMLEERLRNLFTQLYPNVSNIEFQENHLVATFDSLEVTYKISDNNFIEISRKNLEIEQVVSDFDSNFELEPDDCEIKCSRKCYFQEDGLCRYFDWELQEASGKKPDCGEPFIYLEQRGE